jgi:hypothetical protein
MTAVSFAFQVSVFSSASRFDFRMKVPGGAFMGCSCGDEQPKAKRIATRERRWLMV